MVAKNLENLIVEQETKKFEFLNCIKPPKPFKFFNWSISSFSTSPHAKIPSHQKLKLNKEKYQQKWQQRNRILMKARKERIDGQ